MSDTEVSPKNQLMIAKQHLDKLSVFIVGMANFYAGVHPSADGELTKLKKLLSGKPEYDAATELTAKLNDELKKESKLFTQRNNAAVQALQASLRKLNQFSGLSVQVKKELTNFTSSLLANKSAAVEPLTHYEAALKLYDQAIDAHNQAQKTAEAEDGAVLANPEITTQLHELLAPLQAAKGKIKDKNLEALNKRINAKHTAHEQVQLCVDVIRHMVRNVIKESSATSKVIVDLQKALNSVSKDLKVLLGDIEVNDKAHVEQDNTLQGELKSLNASISKASDLETFKVQVKRSLQKMNTMLVEGQKREKAHEFNLYNLSSEMTRHMDLVEKESVDYKKQIFNQRTLTLTDVLTQLPNRLSYEEKIEYEFAQYQINKTPMSLAMIGVDNLSKVNNKFGRAVGDKTLQIIANSIRKYLPPSDFVARWGGEEFIVLFPNTSLSAAYVRMEAIRKKIANMPFMFKGDRVTITMSTGISQFDKTVEEAFNQADHHLYLAKNNGRNMTVYEELE